MATIAPPSPVQRPKVRREPSAYDALKAHFAAHPGERSSIPTPGM